MSQWGSYIFLKYLNCIIVQPTIWSTSLHWQDNCQALVQNWLLWKDQPSKIPVISENPTALTLLSKVPQSKAFLFNTIFWTKPSVSQRSQHFRTLLVFIYTFSILRVICMLTWTTWFHCTKKKTFYLLSRTNTTFSRFKKKTHHWKAGSITGFFSLRLRACHIKKTVHDFFNTVAAKFPLFLARPLNDISTMLSLFVPFCCLTYIGNLCLRTPDSHLQKFPPSDLDNAAHAQVGDGQAELELEARLGGGG